MDAMHSAARASHPPAVVCHPQRGQQHAPPTAQTGAPPRARARTVHPCAAHLYISVYIFYMNTAIKKKEEVFF
jgi:hypothetical protein